jgi:hypothetical protein
LERAFGSGRSGGAPLAAALGGAAGAVGAAALFLRGEGVQLVAPALVMLALLGGGAGRWWARRSTVTPVTRGQVAVLNLYAEGLVTGALAYYLWEGGARYGLTLGLAAFAGALLLTYARTRVEASAGFRLAEGPAGLAGREGRLLLLALGVALGGGALALVLVCALTHLTVGGYLVQARARLAAG